MPERCFNCKDQGFYCQEPSVPLIQGRWKASLDDKEVNLDREKMDGCTKRAKILAQNGSVKEGGVIIFAGKRQ